MVSEQQERRLSAEEIHMLSPPSRPAFHQRNTNDRLRESSLQVPFRSADSNLEKCRKSKFKELGLDTDDTDDGGDSYSNTKEFWELTGLPYASSSRMSEQMSERENGDYKPGSGEPRTSRDERSSDSPTTVTNDKPWYAILGKRPKVRAAASPPPPAMAGVRRAAAIALLIAVVFPGFSYYNGREKVTVNGATARTTNPNEESLWLNTRADSPTQVCTRWSQQVALLNGTLYVYGGQAKTSGDQTSNTWNNNFFTLDLTKSWDIKSPAFSSLPQPSGPPAVANGFLWNDYNNLYLYGGEFADNPYVNPAASSTWKYDVRAKTWTELSNPQTSAGNFSATGGIPVQRAAEGAGLSVPELGLSWYFGGHLDLATTPGWSNLVARVYLKSLLEFTHPGYTNDGVQSLSHGTGAGDGGVYRNITEGGLQGDATFSERADGALVFVPGWGERGILLGLAGGTDVQFASDLSTLDVFDIKSSTWYHQQTTGTPPGVRVNPCVVIASAPDASSFQIYLWGGQNLEPYKAQTQYSDMYILSIPSFTWIFVNNQGNSHIPVGRSGHTCTMRDGQMILVGGYVGNDIPCDSPGVYVFNATSLTWSDRFTALNHPADLSPENSVLAGSFGYRVPDVVAHVIGGDGGGGATATTPAAGSATAGPFATGKPPVFTITASGSTATITQWGPGATAGSGLVTSSGDDRRPGLIAAGVIAGLAGLLAIYLGWCAWLYRRQMHLYKAHLAVANSYDPSEASRTSFAGLTAFFGRRARSTRLQPGGVTNEKCATRGKRHESSSTADSYAWVPGNPMPDDEAAAADDALLSPGGLRPPAARYGGAVAAMPGSSGAAAAATGKPTRNPSGASRRSADEWMDGREPSFFSVVLGPRRALRVVNGLAGEEEEEH